MSTLFDPEKPTVYRIVHSLDEISKADLLAAYHAGEQFVYAGGPEQLAIEMAQRHDAKRDADDEDGE